MADLENLLLQAAGRTGTSARKNQSHPHSRWRREGSFSDGSDSKEDDSDNSKFNKRRHSGSQVPLKKRLDPPEKDKRSNWVDDNDDLSGDDSDSAPSVGSDLYRDEADKEELGKLTELDREMILAERSTKIDDYRLKKKARASSTKTEKSRKESPPPLSSRGRSSVRTERTAAKTDALNELRAKRMRQQDPEGYRRLRDSGGVTGSAFGNRDASPPKHRSLPIPASYSSDSDDEGTSVDGKDDKLHEDIDIEDNSEDLLTTSKSEPIRYEDVKEITVRRSKLAKWLMEPFFENIVVGCFVRVGIGKTHKGPKYRLCVIKNVDASDPDRTYKLEGRTTYKYLNCVWGSEASAARWQMAMVSDSLPTEDEFKEWVREVERNGGRVPCRKDVNDKKEEIKKASTFVYSADTVKQMIKEKKSASSRPLNVAAEKDRLRKEIEAAESHGNGTEVDRIRAKLKELEDLSRQPKRIDAKAIKLAEMNRKNRAENFRNASELKPINTSLKAGEAGYDPFSRRWTRSMNYYVPAKPGIDGNRPATNGVNENAVASSGDANGVTAVNGVEVGVLATAAALEAAAGAGKLVDTTAPVDLGTESNSLHNFDLPISLAGLQKFGGPHGVHLGFMARKQKIEGIIGYRVPDNDGRRHVLTLSVSDYKRRRGLL